MAHPLDRSRALRQDAEAAKETDLREIQFRKDVQDAMNQPGMRRIVWRFLTDMGVDASPFNTNAMAQSRGIGMQDAGKWWLNVIRAHCPEKEAQIRKEAMTAAKKPTNEDEANDD